LKNKHFANFYTKYEKQSSDAVTSVTSSLKTINKQNTSP